MILTVSDIARNLHKTQKRQGGKKHPVPTPTCGQDTQARLSADARQHPAVEGMAPADVQAWVNVRLNQFIASYPPWYGHTTGAGQADARGRAAIRQYQARRERDARDVREKGETRKPTNGETRRPTTRPEPVPVAA